MGDSSAGGHRTKVALARAGRPDVFVYFNDGPADIREVLDSHNTPAAPCGDHFSMDSYQDLVGPCAPLGGAAIQAPLATFL